MLPPAESGSHPSEAREERRKSTSPPSEVCSGANVKGANEKSPFQLLPPGSGDHLSHRFKSRHTQNNQSNGTLSERRRC